ncbi:hypothetical protein NT6N_14170 [Oceaniferula spumae]|uniref:Succinate dehydrogenase n=1 Tax=Oceaniferula spumae TaxID=2979115 RepID=A0AAT9FKA5_9BACT
MNLNKFKKTIGKTNPEKGLRDLAGARKAEYHHNDQGAIRVKGKYISHDYDRFGRVFGITAYLLAWLYVPCTVLSFFLPPGSIWNPFSIFLTGMFAVHGFALVADGLRNSNAPWAMKGIKIYWMGVILLIVLSMIISMLPKG